MSSLNVAEIAVLLATPLVVPGMVVTGTVTITRGRVTSGAGAVVKVHTKLFTSVKPVVSAAPVVMVAVQVVLKGRLPFTVNEATRLAAM